MAAITTFDSTKEALLDMLKSIQEGKSQLPDFQRGWVWDNEHIVSLLASIWAASQNWWKFDLAISYTLLSSRSILLGNQGFL